MQNSLCYLAIFSSSINLKYLTICLIRKYQIELIALKGKNTYIKLFFVFYKTTFVFPYQVNTVKVNANSYGLKIHIKARAWHTETVVLQ